MKNPEITKYIDESPEFARAIMNHIRDVVQKVCPETEEFMRWGHSHFYYKKKGMCFLQALKGRVTFGTWFEQFVFGSPEMSQKAKDAHEGMGFMKSIADVPSDDILTEYVTLAMKAIDENKRSEVVPKAKAELVIPEYVTSALAKNKAAEEAFSKMSPSHKREYVNWIVDSKSDETRDKRIAQMMEQVVEGKSKNWKYQ